MTKTQCQDRLSVLSFRGLLNTPDSLNNSIKIIYITILPHVQVKNEMFVCSNTVHNDNSYHVIWYALMADQSDMQAAGGSWTINSTRGVIINNPEEINLKISN
jgi:hypothetical protein